MKRRAVICIFFGLAIGASIGGNLLIAIKYYSAFYFVIVMIALIASLLYLFCDTDKTTKK